MSQYLNRIQMLRFAAAAMVLLGHAQLKIAELATEVAGSGAQAAPLLRNTTFFAGGVDVFFVLSGFIMYTIAHDDFSRPGAAAGFFMRRIARIVPAYWIFTTLMILATQLFGEQVRHGEMSLGSILGSYLFIPVPNAYGDLYPVLMLGWTLNFEMLFYVVFALALPLQRKYGLPAIFAAVGALALVGVVLPSTQAPLAFWCNPIVLEFLYGILLAMLYQTGWRMSAAAGWLTAALGIALLYVGSDRSPASPFWSERALWMGLPAMFICAATALTSERRAPGRLGRLLMLGGDASYALYLSHPFTLVALAMAWHRFGFTNPWAYLLAVMAGSTALAIVFHRLIEKPVTLWLNAWFRRVSATAPLIPAAIPSHKGRN